MGRGDSSQAVQPFDEVDRFALDTIGDGREEGQKALDRFFRHAQSNSTFLPELVALISNGDAQPFLRDSESEPHRLIVDYIIGSALGHPDPAVRVRLGQSFSADDLLRPWLVASGIEPLFNPLICPSVGSVGTTDFHLRETVDTESALCGEELTDDQQRSVRYLSRGAWQGNPAGRCILCDKIADQRPQREGGEPVDPVVEAATETARFPVLADDAEGFYLPLRALTSERLIALASRPGGQGAATKIGHDLFKLSNDLLNPQAAAAARQLAAERWLAMPASKRIERLLDHRLCPNKGTAKERITLLRVMLERAYGIQLSKLPWPNDPSELRERVLDPSNEVLPRHMLQAELLTRMVGCYWQKAIGHIKAAAHQSEVRRELIEIWRNEPEAAHFLTSSEG